MKTFENFTLMRSSLSLMTCFFSCCHCAADPQALPQHGWVQPLRSAGCHHSAVSGRRPQGQLLLGGHFLWLWILQAICLHLTYSGLRDKCCKCNCKGCALLWKGHMTRLRIRERCYTWWYIHRGRRKVTISTFKHFRVFQVHELHVKYVLATMTTNITI